VDNRLVSLELVEHGLTKAAMFHPGGEVVQAADVLYKKCILLERGSFRPVTRVTVDMLRCAREQFARDPRVEGQPVVEIMEMTLKNLLEHGRIDHADFLDRVDLLGSLGKTVLISNYAEHHRMASYLRTYTKQMIGIVLGVPTLREIFDEKYYADLDGGILESFGRLFKNDLKLYVYPQLGADGSVQSADKLEGEVAPHLRNLYRHLLDNDLFEALANYDPGCLPIQSRDVLERIRCCDPAWEAMVPPEVAALIKSRDLFGHGECRR